MKGWGQGSGSPFTFGLLPLLNRLIQKTKENKTRANSAADGGVVVTRRDGGGGMEGGCDVGGRVKWLRGPVVWSRTETRVLVVSAV